MSQRRGCQAECMSLGARQVCGAETLLHRPQGTVWVVGAADDPGDRQGRRRLHHPEANIDAGNYGPPGSAERTRVAALPIGFRADAAQPFDARCLSWQIPEVVGGREATVSIWTIAGRLKGVRVLAAAHDLALLRTRPVGETDLHCRDGKWFLYATVEAPEAPLEQPVNGFLGVDLGIVNIAASSDGQRLAGARLNRYRKRQLRLRARFRRRKPVRRDAY